MTTASARGASAAQLDASLLSLHRVLPLAGYGVAAAALENPGVAQWVRRHGVTVYAQDASDLEALWHNSIRPVQAIMRCGSTPETIRSAVHAGVSRFIIGSAQEAQLLTQFAHRTKYIYLSAHAPILELHRRLQVIGVHCEVDDSSGHIEWACTAERLLCRMAFLRSCALRPARISLTGCLTQGCGERSAQEMTSIASAVRDALDQGSQRWGLTRPQVLLAPGPSVDELHLAA
jgi:hypothetical protein